MRYPHNNFPQDWSLTAGYGFGAVTSYGFHEAQDVNDLGAGNSDYGKPIYAETDGVIDLIHNHTVDFGRHFFLKINGPWGTRWMHHAHCSEILVSVGQQVKEGQLIAKIGNSGTTYAHDHWACCKVLTSDNIANSQDELNQYWENPIEFVKKWQGGIISPPTMTDDEKRALEVLKNAWATLPDNDKYKHGNLEGYARGITEEHLHPPTSQTFNTPKGRLFYELAKLEG